MSCVIAQIRSAAISIANNVLHVIPMIRDHVPEAEQAAAAGQVAVRCAQAALALAAAAKKHYDGIDGEIQSNYDQEYVDRMSACADLSFTCGDQIEKCLGGGAYGILASTLWATGIQIMEMYRLKLAKPESARDVIIRRAKMVAKYDASAGQKILRTQYTERINAYKAQIAKLPVAKRFKWVKAVIGAGLILTAIGLSTMYGVSTDAFMMCMLVVLGLIGLGLILTSFPASSQTIEKNKETVAGYQKEIKQLEDEMAGFGK